MHRRKKFPRIKSVFFHLLLLCTKFQSPRSNNEFFCFLLVGPLKQKSGDIAPDIMATSLVPKM